MASVTETIDVILQATDKATPVIAKVYGASELLGKGFDKTFNQAAFLSDSASNAFGKIGNKFGELNDKLAPLNNAMLGLTTSVTTAATAMAGYSLVAAKDYETAILGLKKVSDESSESVDLYGEKIKELAGKYGLATNDMIDGVTNFVAAGFSLDQSFRLLEQSTKLMIAGEISAAQSSEYLISILKGFNVPLDQAAASSERLADILDAVSNKYATDVNQLAQAMAMLSPIASQMGFSFEETAGILTPVIEIFRSGSEAANSMRTGLLRLTDDTGPVVEALTSIGVSQYNSNGVLKSGKDILFEVAKAFQGLDENTKTYIATQLSGVEQAPKMVKAFDNLKYSMKITEDAMNSQGTAQKEVDIRLKSLQTSLDRAKTSFNNLAIEMGQKFAPEAKGVIDATTLMLSKFEEASKNKAFDEIFYLLKGQLESVEVYIKRVAENIPAALAKIDWTSLKVGLTSLSSGFGDLFDALSGEDITTVEGLANVLQKFVDIIGNGISYVGGFLDGLSPLAARVENLSDLFSEISPKVTEFIGYLSGLSQSAETIAKAIGSLVGVFGGLLGIIGTVAGGIFLWSAASKAAAAVGISLGASIMGLAGSFAALRIPLQIVIAFLTGMPELLLLNILRIGGLGTALSGLLGTIGAFVAANPLMLAGLGAIGASSYYVTSALLEQTGAQDKISMAIGDTIDAIKEWLGTSEAERKSNEIIAKQKSDEAKERKQNADSIAKEKAALDEKAKAEEAEAKRKKEIADETQTMVDIAAQLGLVYDETTHSLRLATDGMDKFSKVSTNLTFGVKTLGEEYNQFTNNITAGGQKIIGAFNRVATDATTTGDVITKAFAAAANQTKTMAELKKLEDTFKNSNVSAQQLAVGVQIANTQFLRLAEAEIKVVNGSEKLLPGWVKQEAETRGLSLSLQQLIKDNQNLSEEQKASNKRIDEANEKYETNIDKIEDASDAAQELIDAEIEIAQAKGDTNKVLDLQQQKLELEIETNKQLIEEKQKLIAELEKELALKKEAAATDGETNAAEQKDIETTQRKIDAVKSEVTGLETKNQALERVKNAQNQNTESTNRNSQANEENAKSQQKVVSMSKVIAEHLAWARGEADKLSEKARLLFETHWTNYLAKESQTGAESFNRATQALVAYNSTITDSQKRVGEFQKELFNANAAIKQGEEAYLMATGSIGRVLEAIGISLAKTKKLYYEQAIGAEQLQQQVERLSKDGVTNLELSTLRLDNAIKKSKESFNLLDEEDLSNLNGAIEEAKNNLEELKEASEEAAQELADLNEEILREQGNEDAADRMELENELLEKTLDLENKIAEAEEQKNFSLAKQYEEQLAKVKELYRYKEQNLEKDIEANKLEEEAAKNKETEIEEVDYNEEQQPETTISNVAYVDTTNIQSSASKTITIQFVAPSGNMASIPTDIDESTVMRIVDIIRESGANIVSTI